MSRRRAGALRLHWLGMLLLGLLALMLLTFCLALAQETKETETKKPWTGKLAGGREITQADLDRILQEHGRWLKSEGRAVREGQRAYLSGADLSEADLIRANLREANLREAHLTWADLTWALLDGANLSGAWLEGVNLRGATLYETNLSNAWIPNANLSRAILNTANLSKAALGHVNLSEADLSRANLSDAGLLGANLTWTVLQYANLSRADLYQANLSRANLRWTNLSGTILNETNLSGVVFEPKPGTVSDVSLLLNIWGLSSLKYLYSSHGLVELREAFKKAGLREPERQVTYALNHTRREKVWKEGGLLGKLESLFHLVCFEWPCRYGMNPGRPLEILGLGLFLFTLPYLLALRSRNRETGLWLVLPPDRILGQGSKVRPFKLTSRTPFRPLPLGRWPRLKARLRRGLRRVRLAFFFSLLSAFNLGWRELNVGSWISRLQKHEYTLRATGWPRTVAGLQSLLSVYLLALWVLTYFGRPFD